jgi:hypothetical protein
MNTRHPFQVAATPPINGEEETIMTALKSWADVAPHLVDVAMGRRPPTP